MRSQTTCQTVTIVVSNELSPQKYSVCSNTAPNPMVDASTFTKDYSARKDATMRIIREILDMGIDLAIIAAMLWMLWYLASVW